MRLARSVGWLIEHKPLYGYLHAATDAVKAAASNGHLAILQFIHDQEASLPRGLVLEGSEYDVKRRLVEKPIHWWTTVREGFDEAAANGHLEVVKWIRANHFDGCTTKAMDDAARNGHLDVVKFLHANTTAGCTTLAMDSAASKNRFEVIKWLHANRTDGCTMRAVEHAIAFDNFNIAQWLLKTHPELIPQRNRLWISPDNLFDALLFLEVNYPTMFTPEFARGTRANMLSEDGETSDFLVLNWLNKYPGEPTEEAEPLSTWWTQL